MPPQLALAICLVLVVVLLRWCGRPQGVSGATWLPLLWMFFVGTRYLSQWMGEGTGSDWAAAQLDGSPIDRALFMALILGGMVVLCGRGQAALAILWRNKLVCVFFLVGLASVLWSVDPIISLKRWVKASGNLVMALVLLTEKAPLPATGLVLTRLAILSLPLSLVFINYFPELGRTIHHGQQLFNGAALHKNTLGQLCLLTGIYFAWSFFYRPPEWATAARRLLLACCLALIARLLYLSDSATSQLTLGLALVLLVMSRTSLMARRPARLMAITLLMGCAVIGLQFVADLVSVVASGVGRDASLTTRVPTWGDLLQAPSNAMLGSGYEAFWLTDFGRVMRSRWGVIQAHNGYLELYLNLGILGLAVMLTSIAFGFVNVGRRMSTDREAGVLQLCILVVIVFYNWTEATFYGPNNVWLLFLLGAMRVPVPLRVPIRQPVPQIVKPISIWRRTPHARAVRPSSPFRYRRPGLPAGPGRFPTPRTLR